jgi:UDP-2,3-diacylglucosamine pyrophosphatase LpxH
VNYGNAGNSPMSAIVAFSDVHLGYERADSENLMQFIKELQNRDDLGDVVIIGDFVDLWRRDVIGLEFELSKIVEELKVLQKTTEVHYVIGNHDFHMQYLEDHDYPFKPQPSLELDRFGYTIKFLHGHQCDPLQNFLGPNTSEYLCWTLSDDIGEKKSWLWDMLTSRRKIQLTKSDFSDNIDSLMSPPEDVRRTKALAERFGTLSNFVDCLKAEFRITGKDEFIVYGHTHQPFIDLKKRVANTGSWIKGASPSNTYFEFARWPPQVIPFKGEPLETRSISTLNF